MRSRSTILTASIVSSVSLAFALFAGVLAQNAFAQTPLLVEDFTYPVGSALTANGWTAHSGAGTNTIVTSAPSLVLSGYPGSGVGNAVTLATSGEDVNRPFAAQSTGSVFAAFLVNVSDASTDPAGGYFFHLGPDPVGTTFRGRVFVKKDASNNIAFGISKALTASTDVAFTPFSYALNTTYLIVVKYTIVDGTANDTVSMYVGTTVPSTEPAPTVTATDTTQTDVSPATVSLRQGSATTAPTARVDAIRVGTTWASVTQGSTVNQQHVIDFNGDGKTDFAVVRNTGGGTGGQVTWFINLNGTGTTNGYQWGLATDYFVPVDYDGDRKTDIAVWRPVATGQPSGNAYFYILQSQTNTVRIEDFGQSGDDPTVVGDYNGDGKADVAVYRAGAASGQQSTWFYRTAPGGPVIYAPWGQNGDFPAPGDYDGDGKGDFVVQRNNGGGQARFWMQQSTAGFNSIVFGTPSDTIVPGDYDGDGKTDIAVVRASAGQIHWFVRPSSTGTISGGPTAIFGASATDNIAHGDYDGDGKTDFAVWRQGTFWVLGSTSGLMGASFGAAGDYPLANFNTH
ncbi:MAG: FG-GAP repeat domain-containing protein [Pyrinomonadaceae bacterium]